MAQRQRGARRGRQARARQLAQLWYVDATGKPAVMRVRTGLTDGQNTEVIGQNLKDGMQVIIGTATATTATHDHRDDDESVPAAASRRAPAAREGSDHA